MTTINLNTTIKTYDHDGFKRIEIQEKIWYVSKEEFELVGCMTPEGPSDDFSWKIILTNWCTGSVYELKQIIVGRQESYEYEDEDFYDSGIVYVTGRSCADRLIEKIIKVGKVNLENWKKIK
ncbi:hypothetical protein BI036_gp180 [Morganella phage vB_MmoM_MP1]|uniref:Phage protein n=1 Tax=Morganella phage vB_MmoM_MP1 TaxID=1852628 RepID=A0A192YAM2_9CAUD|nr:hypothetical protein BI036_gp180 [Morganella phage vB_MmoM_MP1]ANM46543.1 hypothetical protein MP1_gp0214 [Morganella phage vB_MmoM_MP1]QQK88227.1 hypothetical protein [Providencia phage PSTRCR_127]